MNILFHHNYREVLKSEFSNRLKSNARYSLRAFARDLSLSAATISHVLLGRKGLSTKTAAEIAEKLGYQYEEKEFFLSLVSSESARSQTEREQALIQVNRLKRDRVSDSKEHELRLDAFEVISNWYHFPILELIKMNSKIKPNQIAKKLLIREIEVKFALSRLMRLNLIRETESGYEVIHETVISSDMIKSDAIKKFHNQILDRAKDALFTQSIDERYFRTMCFPFQVSDIHSAQSDLKSLFEQFMQKHSNASGEHVYTMSLQFFRTTEKEHEKK